MEGTILSPQGPLKIWSCDSFIEYPTVLKGVYGYGARYGDKVDVIADLVS